MILHRIVDEKYSKESDLFNGIGASRGGGRWNPVNMRAVYAAAAVQVSASEVGYRKIVGQVDLYHSYRSNNALFRRYAKTKMLNQKQILAKFDMEFSSTEVIDLTTDSLLFAFLKDAGLGFECKILDLRTDYNLDAERRSQKIGEHVCNLGKQILVVESVRHKGHSYVIYPSCVPRERLKLISQVDVYFSAVNSKHQKISPGDSAERDLILFGLNGNESLIAVNS